MNRRELLKGGLLLMAAPSIVKASSLMPIKVYAPNNQWFIHYEVSFDRLIAICRGFRLTTPRDFIVPTPKLLRELHRVIPYDLGPDTAMSIQLPIQGFESVKDEWRKAMYEANKKVLA